MAQRVKTARTHSKKHSAVSDRLRVSLFVELLGCGTGRYQRVETGDRAAGNCCKQYREHVLNAVSVVNCKACHMPGEEESKVGWATMTPKAATANIA